MHVDPLSTEGWNSLLRGHKWWVLLPSDIYEFDEDLSCDESCSDLDKYVNVTDKHTRENYIDDQKNALWFAHILPQIR